MYCLLKVFRKKSLIICFLRYNLQRISNKHFIDYLIFCLVFDSYGYI